MSEPRDSILLFPSVNLLEQEHQIIQQHTLALQSKNNGAYFIGIPLERNEEIIVCSVYTLGFMLIFAILRFRSKNLLQKLFLATGPRKNIEVILSDGIVNNSYHYLLALTLSFSILAIATAYYRFGSFQIQAIISIFILLILYHFCLLLLIRIMGWCFNRKAVAMEMIAHIWAMNITGGMFFAPWVIAMLFMKTFAVHSILIFLNYGVLLYLMYRFIRWCIILFANRVSILYMILYLCALEIVPLMIFYKFITD